MIVEKIKENVENFKLGLQSYIPHPKELGAFTEWFPGRMKGDLTCITGGTSSAKTSLAKFLVFKAIEWAIKNKKNYKVLWFGLEESEEQFDYSLMSFLIYEKSQKKVRYNIEHFEGLGKIVQDQHLASISELEKNEFAKYKSHVTFIENVSNSYGIYKGIRKLARERGTFKFKGQILDASQLDDKDQQWDNYISNDPNELVEIVVDHLGELHVQKDEHDLRDAMTNLVKKLRFYVAKSFKYSVLVIHQQMLEMENLEHVKENFVYASLQGLG